MKSFVPIIYLFAFLGSVPGNWIILGDEMSYRDLENMNVSCPPWDSCVKNRTFDSPGFSYPYSCSCDSQCWEYGTCCVDAPHRDYGPPIHECRKIDRHHGAEFFMVHKCSENTHIDPTWKSKCEEEWNGEYDMSVLSPVTSLDTYKSYKNYYCFRCHEATDNVTLWHPSLSGNFESSGSTDIDYNVTYSEVIRLSLAAMDEIPFSSQFFLTFTPPKEIREFMIQCRRDIVSDCPKNWTNKDVIDKCRAYTAVVITESVILYKNAHCALCNYVSLRTTLLFSQMRCKEPHKYYEYETYFQEPEYHYENKTFDQTPVHDF